MMSVKYLYESAPTKPDMVIIQNNFYSKGLTQKQIYDYYVQNEKIILKEIGDRKVILFIMADNNNLFVKRKLNNELLMLNSGNYKDVLNGRTISVHSTLHPKDHIRIVDIDGHDFEQNKEATLEVYNYLKRIVVSPITIRFTGKNSFHILIHDKHPNDVKENKDILEKLLEKGFEGKYLIDETKRIGEVNLDLSSNKPGGGFITLNALSILGLKCVEILPGDLHKFKRGSCII